MKPKLLTGAIAAAALLGLMGMVPNAVRDAVVVREATYQPSEIDAARESIALSLMGQLQMSIADLMWLKSMEYLHRGSLQRMPTRGEEELGFMKRDSSNTAVGLGHTEGVNLVLDRERDWRGLIGEIERNIACYSEEHIHDDPVELIPWYQMAVKLNPKLERLYTMGAFFLSDFAREPAEAREMLVAGLQANPNSFEVKAALGRLLFEYADRLEELEDEHHAPGEYEPYMPESREEAFAMAVELLREAVDDALRLKLALRDRQEAFDEFQKQIHGESYVFLSKSLAELGDYEQAVAVCDEGWEFSKFHLIRVQRRVAERLQTGEVRPDEGNQDRTE
ncbi:MAG: hypothetical protein KF886_18715 [Candidatus Hydrogenedentes bacterium]|nr:hypothetical protein [Candidatus Hydrogenedentota bacterium]